MSVNQRFLEVINFLISVEKIKNKSDFASKVEVNLSRISEIANNKYTPSIDLQIKVYKLFNIDLNWLITGDGNMCRNETPVSVVRSVCEECKAHKRTIENLNDTIYMYKEKLSICEKRENSIRTIHQEKTL